MHDENTNLVDYAGRRSGVCLAAGVRASGGWAHLACCLLFLSACCRERQSSLIFVTRAGKSPRQVILHTVASMGRRSERSKCKQNWPELKAKVALEKPGRFRTSSGLTERLGRVQTATAQYWQIGGQSGARALRQGVSVHWRDSTDSMLTLQPSEGGG